MKLHFLIFTHVSPAKKLGMCSHDWFQRLKGSVFFLRNPEIRSGSALFAMGEDVDGNDKDVAEESDWGKPRYSKT